MIARIAPRLALLCAVLVAMVLTGMPRFADAQQTYRLRFASYIGKSAAQSRATEWWAEEIDRRTNGRIKIQFFYGGALLPATDILRGVADGRADLGYVANAYHPAELPLSSVVGIPFVTSNAEAQMRTFSELYRRNAAFRAEWDKQGVHVLLFHPLSENIVGMRQPIRSADDLRGKRIRGLGYINQVLQIAGASPAAIAAPEVYEALQRGTIDGYSGYAFEVVTALRLQEVAPHTVGMGTGNYVFAVTPITRATWEKMPADLRAIVTEVSDQYITKFLEILVETENQVCDAIRRSNGTVSVFPETEVAKLRERIGTQINQLWAKDVASRGADGEAFLADYLATLRGHEGKAAYVSGVKRCAERKS